MKNTILIILIFAILNNFFVNTVNFGESCVVSQIQEKIISFDSKISDSHLDLSIIENNLVSNHNNDIFDNERASIEPEIIEEIIDVNSFVKLKIQKIIQKSIYNSFNFLSSFISLESSSKYYDSKTTQFILTFLQVFRI
jgi:hypothetical protein